MGKRWCPDGVHRKAETAINLNLNVNLVKNSDLSWPKLDGKPGGNLPEVILVNLGDTQKMYLKGDRSK